MNEFNWLNNKIDASMLNELKFIAMQYGIDDVNGVIEKLFFKLKDSKNYNNVVNNVMNIISSKKLSIEDIKFWINNDLNAIDLLKVSPIDELYDYITAYIKVTMKNNIINNIFNIMENKVVENDISDFQVLLDKVVGNILISDLNRKLVKYLLLVNDSGNDNFIALLCDMYSSGLIYSDTFYLVVYRIVDYARTRHEFRKILYSELSSFSKVCKQYHMESEINKYFDDRQKELSQNGLHV